MGREHHAFPGICHLGFQDTNREGRVTRPSLRRVIVAGREGVACGCQPVVDTPTPFGLLRSGWMLLLGLERCHRGRRGCARCPCTSQRRRPSSRCAVVFQSLCLQSPHSCRWRGGEKCMVFLSARRVFSCSDRPAPVTNTLVASGGHYSFGTTGPRSDIASSEAASNPGPGAYVTVDCAHCSRLFPLWLYAPLYICLAWGVTHSLSSVCCCVCAQVFCPRDADRVVPGCDGGRGCHVSQVLRPWLGRGATCEAQGPGRHVGVSVQRWGTRRAPPPPHPPKVCATSTFSA